MRESLNAIYECQKHANFHDVILFTSKDVDHCNGTYLHVIKTDPINSIQEYCRFIVKELHKYIYSDFVLICQHDGYILNPNAWTDDFYMYDYIGAPWWHESRSVGNGGFSLRSKKFLEIGSELELATYHPEDDILCRQQWSYMISRGIMYAPESVAKNFSIEYCGKYGRKWTGEFGFHDLRTDISAYGD